MCGWNAMEIATVNCPFSASHLKIDFCFHFICLYGKMNGVAACWPRECHENKINIAVIQLWYRESRVRKIDSKHWLGHCAECHSQFKSIIIIFFFCTALQPMWFVRFTFKTSDIVLQYDVCREVIYVRENLQCTDVHTAHTWATWVDIEHTVRLVNIHWRDTLPLLLSLRLLPRLLCSVA